MLNFNVSCVGPRIRNALSTAGNSMTSSERPSPEALLKVPSRIGEGENSGNALEASNALHYRFGGSQSYSRVEFQEKF